MPAWMESALTHLLDFSNTLNASIAAGWMVLAVIVLRLLLKKAPKWSHVALWGLVAVRLLNPFSMESGFSLIPSVQTVPQELLRYEGTQLQAPAYLDVVSNPNFSGAVSVPVGHSVDYVQWRMLDMTFLWLAGMAVLLLYTAVSYWRLRRRVDTAVRCRDNIFQSENVSSAFVLGILRPRIYLPLQMDAQDLEHVIAHEQAHIHRKDHWWKPLGFLLLTIHWFNPFLWLAYVLLCRDIELACDERVIRELAHEQRADYTQALVSCSVNRRMVAACPLAFGEVGVRERVKSIMNYKKPARGLIVLSLVACVIVAVCFLTNPKRDDSFRLRIVVPAGNQESFVYADEEISPLGKHIIVTSGEGLGDTEVFLKPVQVKTETAYEPEYLTPGLPVKMEVEKGAWFKIGVNMQNETDEDKVVYVNVEHVEVRIAEEQVQSATQESKQSTVIHYPAHKALYEPTPIGQIDANYDNEEFVITKLHYENLDGEWVCEGYPYKYRLEISGRLHNAAKNMTYIVLSNTEDITFDQTWKASGLSSYTGDYFDAAVAVIVGSRLFS